MMQTQWQHAIQYGVFSPEVATTSHVRIMFIYSKSRGGYPNFDYCANICNTEKD